ncbi:tRNA (guanosine(37)-N1)-methyltransferase TrmD [Brevibacterium luteolum]|uniref:tRNA (guanine-N(1)-)-methyltransferase n=1 Tax=Brevibacterium luteolum TaxID=199591 RepID=A0A849AM66_9MICO|nr:tRNA (guanosine(37)-N1)-methyltransferase TrmD [Brevibacterium luteolum]MBM7528213.1 tRNA (guanine37-N1)-methyltransferase [Brevibacterium luteolum]MCT1872979.1 tRNA (guanosine(37)-N1)-methyltransferase TrmD [Brevibacterium luteolum]MCT1890727.1 tRNA (guanosine(37)-N1)-methyltransferase TrmD [Brevibacterium luteolum]MCT1892851.1 tRNA (guanosine(37)-N1)-methyltransferase TrmD [Brevibacterium luteolum]MCT1922191.1 tRNA (guanosine(37)-N1)-methyltransferase TrmD [Brevibacterium luteolum]
MRIDVISIFPDYLAPLQLSLTGKAMAAGLLDVGIHDLRDWTTDRHRTVDDTPYGGGAGMVMKPEPWAQALTDVAGLAPASQVPAVAQATAASGPVTAAEAGERPVLIVPSPAGAPFTQADARRLAGRSHLVFACGRYEGIDQRVIDWAGEDFDVELVSIGDYVLNGGEVAALVIIEAVARLIPGFMGNPDSLIEESYEDGLLEYPVYTKPADWRGNQVPDVLLSGNHAAIARWRRDQRLIRTQRTRPDLLAGLPDEALDARDWQVLTEAEREVEPGGPGG